MVQRLAVIGGGTMGTGIIYTGALAACSVFVVEPSQPAAERMHNILSETAQSGVRRGRLQPDQAEQLLQRIEQVASIEDIPEHCDLIVETVPERLDLKHDILQRASQRNPRMLASNTSALSINRLAEAVADPTRFLGMHFFNPVWSIKLIELIRGDATTDACIEDAKAFAQLLNKESLVVKDVPGFATSRLDFASCLEAIRMVESGVASAEDIDRGAVVAYGHPVGPLRLSDIVGLDVRLDIARVLEEAHGSRFAPPQLLIDMVARGELGQKSGQGFFTWDDGDGAR